jgi:hypothetical protein
MGIMCQGSQAEVRSKSCSSGAGVCTIVQAHARNGLIHSGGGSLLHAIGAGLRVSEWGYAGSWIWTSENTPSRHLGE